MITLEELYLYAKKNNLTNVLISYPVIDQEDGTECYTTGIESALFIKHEDGTSILRINDVNQNNPKEKISFIVSKNFN